MANRDHCVGMLVYSGFVKVAVQLHPIQHPLLLLQVLFKSSLPNQLLLSVLY